LRFRNISRKFILTIIGIILCSIIVYIKNIDLIEFRLDIYSKNGVTSEKILTSPKSSIVSGRIFIDGNWSAAKAAGICTGYGTYSQPYVIKNLIIDGEGMGTCINIEGSNHYFKIVNCTLFNSRYAGIRIDYAYQAQIINNNCSFHNVGLHISHGDSISISGNLVSDNIYGIQIWNSGSTEIRRNNAYDNQLAGIDVYSSNGGYIRENNVSHSSCGITLQLCDNLDISENIIANNDDHGIFTSFCNHNTITKNIANNNSQGIYLYKSNYNSITRNTANNNVLAGIYSSYSTNEIKNNVAKYNFYGIYLHYCEYSTVSGNTLMQNEVCIIEDNCQGNVFSNNNGCTYGELPVEMIFNILIAAGGIIIVLVIVLTNTPKRKRNNV
jgi:parallel beta-helix repeat protein